MLINTFCLVRRLCWFGLVLALVSGGVGRLGAELPLDLVAPAYRIEPGANDAAWQPLLAELRSQPPLLAVFVEQRFFPFRKTPAELTGEIRLDPAHGLSLRYLTPEESLVVIDARGGYQQDAKGRRRELPDDARAQAATQALLHVLRFDLAALSQHFELYGAQDGAAWRFTFVPCPGPLNRVLQPITVSGDTGLVRRIEMRKSARQRIEIVIAETRTGVVFTPDELGRFFRATTPAP